LVYIGSICQSESAYTTRLGQHPQASVRSTLTLQNEQENCRFTWDWWPRLPPVLPPTTGESFPAPPSPRTSPHERSHPHDGVVFGARVLPAPWLSSVGAVAMSSDLLSAPPLGPHAGGAVALSLELDICLLLRLPVTPSAPLTPLALSCAPRAPHHLTSKTFILSDIAHMHQSTVVFQFLFAAFEQQNV
jgi:hypothetical protein